MRGLVTHNAVVVPIFAALWVFSWVLDVLPTVDERVQWQARVIVGLSALRAAALSLAAVLTRALAGVLWGLAAFALFNSILLPLFVARPPVPGGPRVWRRALPWQP